MFIIIILSKILGMEDDFKIYVDRLKEGGEEKIDFTTSPHFIGVSKEFKEPVVIAGVAYCTDSDLILRLSIKTKAELDCAICNEPMQFDLEVEENYHAIELAKIAHLVFNFESLVRDAILLQLPHTVECHGGCCPHREQISKYFSRREYGSTKK